MPRINLLTIINVRKITIINLLPITLSNLRNESKSKFSFRMLKLVYELKIFIKFLKLKKNQNQRHIRQIII